MFWRREKKSSYKKDGRLGEVLALIQVLAYDEISTRTEGGIAKELTPKPASAKSWIALAQLHPELFRVGLDKKGQLRASLVSRFVLTLDGPDEENQRRPMLDHGIVNKLMDVALDLHDKELVRAQRWQPVIPIVVALISSATLIAIAIFKSAS